MALFTNFDYYSKKQVLKKHVSTIINIFVKKLFFYLSLLRISSIII